jgi:imidazolonepropionase-like amidohydrolase
MMHEGCKDEKSILIKNGKVYTMTCEGILDGGQVLIKDGIIEDVGYDLEASGNTEVIDVKGCYVMPGLIDAHCHIGLFETAIGMAGDDGNEIADPVTPELRAIDAIYPLDKEFAHAASHGVTCVATGPGSANPIAGQFIAMKTAGRTLKEMIVKEPLAMKVAFGENPKRVYGTKGQSPVTRMATASLIRTWLSKAREYVQKKDLAKKLDDYDKMPPFDLKLESLELVIRRVIPLKAHAHRADDIMTALRIAEEFNLDITLDHCSEGHLIANELAEYGKGVILGPLTGFPSKPEVANQCPEAAAILCDAGLEVAIMSDLPATHVGYLPMAVGLCMKAGLPEMEAFKSITTNAANILNLGDRIGSLERGKDGDVAVFSSHPLKDITGRCVLSVVNGMICHRE